LFTCRWQELRSSWLTNAYITSTIDAYASLLQEAQVRNYQRWPILGKYVWPNQFVGQTYAEEINYLKKWITDRLAWMDSNIPGDCDWITAINENQSGVEFYPNPCHSEVTFQFGDHAESKRLRITNVLGVEIFNADFSGTEYKWDGRNSRDQEVPAGVYVITVTDAAGIVLLQKRLIRG
jgi:hypothetical protein